MLRLKMGYLRHLEMENASLLDQIIFYSVWMMGNSYLKTEKLISSYSLIKANKRTITSHAKRIRNDFEKFKERYYADSKRAARRS